MPSGACHHPARNPSGNPDTNDAAFQNIRTVARRPRPARLCLHSSRGAAPAAERPRVALETTHGSFVLELDRSSAPETVANFLAYVRAGHYRGTIFHRVIAGFMIQGGGFTEGYRQSPTRAPIRNEADRAGPNDRGTIAMARTRDPHSATTQFFINVADNDFLNHRGRTPRGWGYTVFGRSGRRHGYGGPDRGASDRPGRSLLAGRSAGGGRHPRRAGPAG